MDMRSNAISSPWLVSAQQKGREVISSDQTLRFEALYQRYGSAVFVFLRFLVGSPEVSEDLAVLVFEKAFIHLAEIQELDTVGPWLLRIARNCAVDHFRRCKPTVSLEQLLTLDHPLTATLEETVIAHEERRNLLVYVSRLSEREREVIGLKFALGLQNREIARVLQIPEGTVGSLLYRALQRLRASLGQEGGHSEAER